MRLSSTRRVPGSWRSQSGITLVEMLVATVLLCVVTTMILVAYFTLNRSTSYIVQSNDARGEARDALSRMSVEIRDAQPLALPSGTTTPAYSVLSVAQPMEVDFYSAYNLVGASDGSGTGAMRLTRLYLDTSGTSPQKTLMWQRDTNNNGSFDANDRTMVLARDVVNASTPNTGVTPTTTYTALFTYAYRDASGNYTTTDNASATLDLTKVIAVQIRVISDMRKNRAPTYTDLVTTVRPRNASAT
jgi:type II secretory pathway component PulJ